MRALPAQEILQSLLRYDPADGWLYWRSRGDDARWDSRYAGERAGSLSEGYIRVKLFGQLWPSHRLIWKLVHGAEPAILDHIDLDRGNNRLENLRAADAALNGVNTSRAAGQYLRGVRKGRRGRFFAQHKVGAKMVHLGSFDTQEEAHAAYVRAVNKRFGQAACPARNAVFA